MPLLDELGRFVYPFNDPNDLHGLKKKEKVLAEFQCRFCKVNFEWEVPEDAKFNTWRCPSCKGRNGFYI